MIGDVYFTVHKSLIYNGNRHREKATVYIENGQLDYAIGSFRKMLRNYEAAQALSDFKDAGLVEDYMDRLAQMIANQLMTGEG